MDLTLRPTTLEDLPILFEHQVDPIGAKMAAFASRDWDAFVAHEAKLRDDRAAIRRTIVVDGEVVGSLMCWGDDEREIGYWIGREHWGRGIATVSVRAFVAELPDGRDTWWTVATRASIESVRVQKLDAIRTYALPAIEQQLAEHPREGL